MLIIFSDTKFMEEIPRPKTIEVKQQKVNQATITIEPCYPGYGTTLGNALRRVLLSSLSGAAVISVKIKGVAHEFSTIPHIKEDILEIILNLKNLRMKLFSEEPVKLLLFSKGKRKILASDIKAPSTCQIVNPDLVIAEATHKDAVLDMEIEVGSGRGYGPTEAREEPSEVGKILVDAIFTPVLKVNWRVEHTRVGKRTDFDKLILDITTDGTVSPKEAFLKAAQILKDQFSFLATYLIPKEEVLEEKPVLKVKRGKEAIPIKELNLSTRTYNALVKANLTTIGDIIPLTEKELLKLEGFGKTALKEVKRELKKLKLDIKT